MKHKLTRGVKDAYQRQYTNLLTKRYGNTSGEIKTIVIAGTNGKATTAKYLNELLQQIERKTALLIPEDNESLGVKTIQQFLRAARKDEAQFAVIVLPKEDIKARSMGSIPIDTIVVTNCSKGDVKACKKLLDLGSRYIVLNRDDTSYEELSAPREGTEIITYGKDEASEARIEKITLLRKGSEVRIVIDHQTKLRLATYLVGTANVYNLVAATTALYVMGEDLHSSDEGAARLEVHPTNYEYIYAATPYAIVLDYSPDSMALRSVLGSAKELAKRRLIVAVQADITPEDVVEEIADQVDRLIVVDVNDYKPTKSTLERVTSPDMAIKLALRAARQDDTVLLAGPVFARPDEDGQTYAHVVIQNTLEG